MKNVLSYRNPIIACDASNPDEVALIIIDTIIEADGYDN